MLPLRRLDETVDKIWGSEITCSTHPLEDSSSERLVKIACKQDVSDSKCGLNAKSTFRQILTTSSSVPMCCRKLGT